MDQSTESIEDRCLILRIVERDEGGLRAFIERYGAHVKASLVKRFQGVLGEAEVMGVLNAAAWKVWHYAGKYDPAKGSLAGWFYRIVEREAMDYLQDRGHPHDFPLDFEPHFHTRRPDDTTYGSHAMVHELMQVVAALPPLQRAIVNADLAAGGQADDKRLASLHDSTVNSVRVSRCKAREKIRAELVRRGYYQDADEGLGQ